MKPLLHVLFSARCASRVNFVVQFRHVRQRAAGKGQQPHSHYENLARPFPAARGVCMVAHTLRIRALRQFDANNDMRQVFKGHVGKKRHAADIGRLGCRDSVIAQGHPDASPIP